MDSVDIFLFYVVGFSVLLFLILDSIQESRRTRTGQYGLESEKQLVSDHCKRPDFQEEEEETESPVGARCDFCSTEIDLGNNFNDGVSDSDDKGEEEEEEETFDDWEGIERTELEKSFGEAVVFVSEKSNADWINGDVKLELYGLQKVALEGPCHGSQPMLLNVSARAKWNAWQRLGKMSREMAMEKYIDILVKKAIPGWKMEGDGIGPGKDTRSSEE